jgi:hypothetical protein
MNLKIIKRFIFFVVIFFASVNFAFADFEITEIMYDQEGTDTNREWVEVKNSGSSTQDLSKWFIFTDNVKHKLVPQNESIIPPGGYAVIVQNVSQFALDYPNFQGLLFDSSWTGLNNTGETISLKDSTLNIISSVTYSGIQGGNGNGHSLSLINGVWQNGIPTPGKDNQMVVVTAPAKAVNQTPKGVLVSTTKNSDSEKVGSNSTVNSVDDSAPKDLQIINLNDLSSGSGSKNDKIPDFVFPLGLAFIIGAGIWSFMIINKKNKILDYKYGKITADDITIVE